MRKPYNPTMIVVEFRVCTRCDNDFRLGFSAPSELVDTYEMRCAACGDELDRVWWSEPVRYTFPVLDVAEVTPAGMRYRRLGGYQTRRTGGEL
jgi:hypothetical protein